MDGDLSRCSKYTFVNSFAGEYSNSFVGNRSLSSALTNLATPMFCLYKCAWD